MRRLAHNAAFAACVVSIWVSGHSDWSRICLSSPGKVVPTKNVVVS